VLLRAGLTLTAAGAAVGASAAAAAASEPSVVETPLGTVDTTAVHYALDSAVRQVDGATTHALGPVKDLQANPLAGTAADPLNNVVGTQVADFRPLTTEPLTGPAARGASFEQLPLVGQALGALPG
jgi:hypothetical protein